MKKLLAIVLALALMPTAYATAPAQQDVTLELWHSVSGSQAVMLNDMIEKFCAQHPGVNVAVTYLPGDELQTGYVLGANTGDLPHIGFVDAPKVAALVAMNALIDITDQMEADDLIEGFYPGPLQAVTWDGRIYGMPHTSNCLSLFYDVDKLNEVGCQPPTTWDELAQVCKALKDAGYANSFAVSLHTGEEGMFQYVPWLYTAGATIQTLNGERGIQCIQYLKMLVDNGYMSKDVINWVQGDIMNQFKSGNVIMNINGSWNIGGLRADVPDKNWSVVLMPTLNETPSTSVLGGETFCLMNKGGEQHRDIAYELVKFLCAGEGCLEFCKISGRTPTRGDLMAQLPDVLNDPILSVFAKGLETAVSRGPSPRWPEISDAVTLAVHKVIAGTEDAQSAMDQAQKVVNDVIG